MKIHLEDNWYLVSDERQFIISEEKEKKDTEGNITTYMNHKTFHNTVESALRSYIMVGIRKSSVTTFEGYIKKVKEAEGQLDKWFEKAKGDL